MKIETNIAEKTPIYFKEKVINNRKVNTTPVDFNCMHEHCCIKHPVDILYSVMESDAKSGHPICYFNIIELIKNLNVPYMEKTCTNTLTVTTGHLWWKKPVTRTETVENKEYMNLLGKMAADTMSELSRILTNKKFLYTTVYGRDLPEEQFSYLNSKFHICKSDIVKFAITF